MTDPDGRTRFFAGTRLYPSPHRDRNRHFATHLPAQAGATEFVDTKIIGAFNSISYRHRRKNYMSCMQPLQFHRTAYLQTFAENPAFEGVTDERCSAKWTHLLQRQN